MIETNAYKLAEWRLDKMAKEVNATIDSIMREETKWTETELTGKLVALLAVIGSCKVSAAAMAKAKEN